MICVEIDVAKDKHDCFILSLDGEVLADVFTIPNNRDGFENLFQHTNLHRKSLSLRKAKTDRIDEQTIAAMLMSDVDLKSYTDTAYHNKELKSFARYCFDKVRQRVKLKQSVSQ